MTDPETGYVSAAAFRRAVADRLRTEAARRQRPVNELRREFLYQRFLARVFADPDAPWVLKGGVGLLARLADARHSRDIDLYHPGLQIEIATAVQDLTAAAGVAIGDHLRFVVEASRPIQGVDAAAVRIAAYTGATVFDRFTVDLSIHLRPLTGIDRIKPAHVLDLPGLPDLPQLRLYPITDQLADKICAMYGRYGESGSPSSRYRDLVDIILILRQEAVDAADLGRAIRLETTRRGLDLPAVLDLPSPAWNTGYRAIARDSKLPNELHDPAAAMAVLTACLQPLMEDGPDRARTWDPTAGRWKPRT